MSSLVLFTIDDVEVPTRRAHPASTTSGRSVRSRRIRIGLPNDGTVLLSDGVTAVTAGETLTVTQLTGLLFKPTGGAFGQTSTLSYTVTDPAGLSTTGTAT